MDERAPSLLSSRQLGLLLWAGMVSPMIRQVPGAMTDSAGNAAWLSALLCLPAAALFGLFLGRMLRDRRIGEGMGELLCRGLGDVPGRAAAGFYGLWFIFFAGYVLRSGADRFVSAVYPDSREWVFMAVMILLALMAGAGRLKTLARCAQLIAPVLWAVFALVFLFCVQNMELSELWPPVGGASRGVFQGTLPLLGTLAAGAFPVFLAGQTEPGSLSRAFSLSLSALAGLGTALCLATIGTFGAELTRRMNYPFFVMLRGVRIFDLLERVEALVVVQWAAADFLLLGTLLHLAAGNLALAFRGPGKKPGKKLPAACALAVFLCGWSCAPTAFALRSLGRTVIGAVNSVLAFVLLPTLWLAGKRRGRL